MQGVMTEAYFLFRVKNVAMISQFQIGSADPQKNYYLAKM